MRYYIFFTKLSRADCFKGYTLWYKIEIRSLKMIPFVVLRLSYFDRSMLIHRTFLRLNKDRRW